MSCISKYILLEAYKDEPAEIKKIISKISSLSHKRSRLSKAGQDIADVNAEIQKMKNQLLELRNKTGNSAENINTDEIPQNDSGLKNDESGIDGGLSSIWNLDNDDFNTFVNDTIEEQKILKYILLNEFIQTDDTDSFLSKIKLGITPWIYQHKPEHRWYTDEKYLDKSIIDKMSLKELQDYLSSLKYTITLDNKKLSVIYDGPNAVKLYYCGIPGNNDDNYVTTGKITELYTNLELVSIINCNAYYLSTKNFDFVKWYGHYHSYGYSYIVPIEHFKKITCGGLYQVQGDCLVGNQEINIINSKKSRYAGMFKYKIPSLTILNNNSIFNNTTINFETPNQSIIELDLFNVDDAAIVKYENTSLFEIYNNNNMAGMTPEQRLKNLSKKLNFYKKIFNFGDLKTNCASMNMRLSNFYPEHNIYVIALGLEYINNSIIYLKQILELPETASYADIHTKACAFNIYDGGYGSSFEKWLDRNLISMHTIGKKINLHNVDFKFKFPRLSTNYVNNLFGKLPPSITSLFVCTDHTFLVNKPERAEDYYGFHLQKRGSYWELKPAYMIRG